MCGVAGSLGRPGVVSQLARKLSHRGPDRVGIVEDENTAVGAARLRVKGGRGADMPLVSSSGQTVIAVNGEIFNHRDLYRDSEGSDLAGLADLLESEGPRALSRIRGPFALVALDRARRSLILARDELGVRPLFYNHDAHGVAAASEVAVLQETLGLVAMDREAWDHLIAFQFWPRDRTPRQGIRAVGPGSWIRFTRVNGRIRQEIGAVRYDDESRNMEGALESAFDLQGPCALKTGMALSGGLDSSAVASMLVARGHAPDVAVVGWFPDAEAGMDERPHARAVARDLGIPLVEVAITPAAYLRAWQALVTALGGPLAGPGGPSQWLIAEALQREGVKVVFSGQGGDELFGGYERHRLLLQQDLGRPLRPAQGYEPLARLMREDPVRGCLFRGAEFVRHLVPERAAGVERRVADLPGPGPHRAERTLEWETRVLLPGLLLVEDHTLAAFGMEGRVPLLDPALALRARETALETRSPPDAPRRLFRDLLGTRLAAAARRRTDKMGFPHPLTGWWEGIWRRLAHDHPGVERLPELGFRPSVLQALRTRQLSPRGATWLMGCALALHGSQAEMQEATS